MERAATRARVDKAWLNRQAQVVARLGMLRAHVRETGGRGPEAYPSAALLARAQALLAALSRETTAVHHGAVGDATAAANGVAERLEALITTLDRGRVAIELEVAGREH